MQKNELVGIDYNIIITIGHAEGHWITGEESMPHSKMHSEGVGWGIMGHLDGQKVRSSSPGLADAELAKHSVAMV